MLEIDTWRCIHVHCIWHCHGSKNAGQRRAGDGFIFFFFFFFWGIVKLPSDWKWYAMWSSKMSVKSKNFICFFVCVFIGYNFSFNLVKTPWRLGNWFSRYSILGDCKNNKKQRNYLLCLVISLNQYLRLPTHFAWLHHIWWTEPNLLIWFTVRNAHCIRMLLHVCFKGIYLFCFCTSIER